MKEREKKQKKFLKEKMTARQKQEAFFFSDNPRGG